MIELGHDCSTAWLWQVCSPSKVEVFGAGRGTGSEASNVQPQSTYDLLECQLIILFVFNHVRKPSA